MVLGIAWYRSRIPPDVAAGLAEHAMDDELTEREIDVLRLVTSGKGNKQIADQFPIGEATVNGSVKHIVQAWRQRSVARRNDWAKAWHYRTGYPPKVG